MSLDIAVVRGAVAGGLVLGWALAAAPLTADADDDAVRTTAEMSVRVDELIMAQLRQAGVSPAAPADDAQFLRRAALDLNGVIPATSDVSAFLKDAATDKRAKVIDRLLANPRYATHLAQVWSKMLLPAAAQNERPAEVAGFTAWLRRRFAENIRYDIVVADLLTTTGSSNRGGAALFYTASGLKPEELAASTSRIFLGVQIHCAQCHNHPFDHWRQEDFWSYAAFFARVQQAPGVQPPEVELVDATAGEVMLPDTDQVIAPKYLGDDPPSEDADVNRRRQLAIWLVSRDNPYFARVAVNRVWALLFGRGLVHPVDEFGPQNPSSHPQLLDELAAYFVDSGYDLKELFRVLANTEAYQRSSELLSEGEPPAPELFARMLVKTLTPEQLYDSLLRAARRDDPAPPTPVPGQPLMADRQQFLLRFNLGTHEATDFSAGIPQVLALMNGALTDAATDPLRSGILLAIDAPFFSDEERVDALFLAVLSRPPTDAERQQFMTYVKDQTDADERRKALGDILWALLNSPEFILNH